MILLVDSGSTIATWRRVSDDHRIQSCTTGGINPFQIGSDEIVQLLETEFTLSRTGLQKIWFYGAGCAFADKNELVTNALSRFFGSTEIHVNSDLLGTAHALCGHSPGIACILGTGSNSCYYDGHEIVQNVPPLGYVLGDEGSGNALGRKLLSDILKNQLPPAICDLFFETYRTTAGEILDHVYRQPFPNRYLAQFARFVAANIAYPELQALTGNCFRAFFERNVMQYEAATRLPVHFTGSIAFHFSDILTNIAADFGLNVGTILQEPSAALVTFHESIQELSTDYTD